MFNPVERFMHKLDMFQVYADRFRNLLFAWIPSSPVARHPCGQLYAERLWHDGGNLLSVSQPGTKNHVRCAEFLKGGQANRYGQVLLQIPRTTHRVDLELTKEQFAIVIKALDAAANLPYPTRPLSPPLIAGADTLERIAQDWRALHILNRPLDHLIGTPRSLRYAF